MADDLKVKTEDVDTSPAEKTNPEKVALKYVELKHIFGGASSDTPGTPTSGNPPPTCGVVGTGDHPDSCN